MRWGLVPSWWNKTLKDVPATFNARGETVTEKPMFRSAFKRTRCIVPASSYYEWRTINGEKWPYYFSASDAGVLSIASLWDEWNDITSRELLLSCAMIVTEANKLPAAFTIACRYFLPAIVSKRGSTAPPASNSCAQRSKICFTSGPYRSA
jgi:putative SOS response-associated peptidase YedK